MEYQNTMMIYEKVAKLTSQMLVAAKQQDWDTLTELEEHCAMCVAHLTQIEDTLPLSSEARARKLASIKSILADDREIRNIVSPWMERLNKLINNYHVESKLTQSYSQ